MKKIFLMCSERSGSNLLTKIFDSHPKVAGPSTSHIADVILPNLYKYNIINDLDWRDLIEDILYLLKYKNAIWKKQFTSDELFYCSDKRDFYELLSYIYENETSANNKQIAFIKENRIYEFAPFIVQHFKGSSFVYMVRDPRDMAAYWKFSYSIRGAVVRATDVWSTDQIGFLRMKSWIKAPTPTILFEDLVSQPVKILEKLCNELGLKFDSSMLSFHLKPETKKNAQAAIDWRNISKPISANSVGKFKNRLEEEEIKYIEYKCYDLMQSFGYKPYFEKVTECEFKELSTRLSKQEPINKESYKSVSNEEKSRRKRHHKRSSTIHNKILNQVEIIRK